MGKEFDSLVENNIFKWQKVPKNRNIISSRWFFTIKSKSDEGHEFKTRFVMVKIMEKLSPWQQIWPP